jgi:hypothetical protein
MNHRILADYYSAGINSDMFNHVLYAGRIMCTVLNIVDMPTDMFGSLDSERERQTHAVKSHCSRIAFTSLDVLKYSVA